MKNDKKKRAAAIAAVTAYIKSEEEMAAARGPMTGPYRKDRSYVWGMGGRQSQMQIRNLMQIRAFQGSKLR